MNERDFVYWLRGFFEMSNANNMTEEQVKMVKDHLNKVVIHKDIMSLLDRTTSLRPLGQPHRLTPSGLDIIC